jgi:hypothetical protein
LDVIHRSNHCLQRVLFEVDFLHNKRSWSDAHFKSFSFASVATATQIILATLPLYSQNATWRSSTANTVHALKVVRSPVWLLLHKLSSPHYRYIGKMRRGDRLPLTQIWYEMVIMCRSAYGTKWSYIVSICIWYEMVI